MLANRLKKILPHLVSKQQSAFVKDRLILDKIMVAFVTLHYMRNHNSGETGYMALKLDINKAYDRVELVYMEKLMKKMGLVDTWVNLMMQCISKATYSVLIHGEPRGQITPSRGLCQRDPLSPYLFLLCMEGFHGLLRKVKENGDIRGVSICRSAPKLTHLLFADDNLIFCRAKINECEKLEILATYEQASGQQINRDKTTLFFSKSTSPQMQESIQAALGVPVVKQYEKYLGCQASLGGKRRRALTILSKESGKSLKDGKASFCHKRGEKF